MIWWDIINIWDGSHLIQLFLNISSMELVLREDIYIGILFFFNLHEQSKDILYLPANEQE